MTREHEPAPARRARRVLLADASRARLFERDPDNGALRELEDFVHAGSRIRSSELGHDRPGGGAKGDARTAFPPPTALDEREHLRFAQELAQRLEADAASGRLPPWALLASNPFLGRLHAALGPAAAARLVEHVDRDLTRLPLHELEPRLRRLLPPAPAQDEAGST